MSDSFDDRSRNKILKETTAIQGQVDLLLVHHHHLATQIHCKMVAATTAASGTLSSATTNDLSIRA